MFLAFAALLLAVATGGGSVHARRAPSQPLSGAAIGQVACSAATPPRMTRAATFNAEVLLDRLDISPGIIDGKTGENVGKAIAAFQRSRGLAASGKLDRTPLTAPRKRPRSFVSPRASGVKPDGDETMRNVVDSVRTAACGWFTTVLGPGADATHTDHSHDLRQASRVHERAGPDRVHDHRR
jgi:peptidoglycan hydrolase-like protein with peptidoglycan-binding domain